MQCSLCSSPAWAKGFCKRHYYRATSKRTPHPTRDMTDDERFAYYSSLSGDCILWTGSTMGRRSDPAPCFSVGGKAVTASRYAYEKLHGPIPDGQYLRHSCLRRLCVNTDHFYLSDKPNDGPRRPSEKHHTWAMTAEERFHHFTEKSDGCWVWRGAKNTRHYGLFYYEGRTIGAHRYSYALHYGEFPDDLYVCHSCDNPCCVNPAHLFLGTAADNSRDRDEKGRGVHPNGDAHHLSKITNSQVAEIISMKGLMTQKTIAKIFGIDQSHVSRIMNGHKRGRISFKSSDVTDIGAHPVKADTGEK